MKSLFNGLAIFVVASYATTWLLAGWLRLIILLIAYFGDFLEIASRPEFWTSGIHRYWWEGSPIIMSVLSLIIGLWVTAAILMHNSKET